MPQSYQEKMAAAFEDELIKIAEEKAAGMSPEAMKTLGLVGAGALGAEFLRRAERDRKMGRAMRMQQNAY